MKDNEIIELYWKRDESAIAATAESYGNYCYSIAYHILQSPEEAQECVNDRSPMTRGSFSKRKRLDA